MVGGIGCIYSYIGNIVAGKRLDSFIDIGGTVIVAMKTDIAEVGLNKTWLQMGYTYCSICHIDAQSIGKGFYCRFSGTVDIASCIGSIACYRANIYDVSAIALHHTWYHKPCHSQQTFDVGINHRFPIIRIAFIFRFESKSQSCIVYQDIHLLPFCRKHLDRLRSHLTVSHVEGQCQHIRAFLCQFSLDICQTAFVSTCENQSVTVLGKFSCTSQTYSACSTCYQYNLIHYR